MRGTPQADAAFEELCRRVEVAEEREAGLRVQAGTPEGVAGEAPDGGGGPGRCLRRAWRYSRGDISRIAHTMCAMYTRSTTFYIIPMTNAAVRHIVDMTGV